MITIKRLGELKLMAEVYVSDTTMISATVFQPLVREMTQEIERLREILKTIYDGEYMEMEQSEDGIFTNDHYYNLIRAQAIAGDALEESPQNVAQSVKPTRLEVPHPLYPPKN